MVDHTIPNIISKEILESINDGILLGVKLSHKMLNDFFIEKEEDIERDDKMRQFDEDYENGKIINFN